MPYLSFWDTFILLSVMVFRSIIFYVNDIHLFLMAEWNSIVLLQNSSRKLRINSEYKGKTCSLDRLPSFLPPSVPPSICPSVRPSLPLFLLSVSLCLHFLSTNYEKSVRCWGFTSDHARCIWREVSFHSDVSLPWETCLETIVFGEGRGRWVHKERSTECPAEGWGQSLQTLIIAGSCVITD